MIIYPTAKINIGLSVIDKRPDGYHNIITGFHAIGLCDILEYLPDGNQKLQADLMSVSGLDIPGAMNDNLVLRACHEFRVLYPIPFLHIHLHKCIPTGAGLGGGSSDAATLLASLNREFGHPLSQIQLQDIAVRLGSDCPFFLNPEPAIGRGRGEKLEPLTLDLKGWYLQVYNPGVHVSTRDAYAGVTLAQTELQLERSLLDHPSKWKNLVTNAFEETVFTIHPVVKEIKESLYQNGATFAAMSGSGSSVFALFIEDVGVMRGFEEFLIWQELL